MKNLIKFIDIRGEVHKKTLIKNILTVQEIQMFHDHNTFFVYL